MKKKNRFFQSGAIITAVVIAIITSLFLTEVSEAEIRKSRREYNAGQITVTAQKQEEKFQDVPVSMTVVDDFELEDRNIDGIWRLADYVPNLINFDVSMSSLFSQPTMRGISASPGAFNAAVGLYVDGSPILASPGFAADFLNVERVEILRGPQGTLYGKNTEAGVINIITKRPGNDVNGKVIIQAGEDKRSILSASVAGPVIKDTLFLSLSGKIDRKDGLIENRYKDEKADDRLKYFGRTRLLWTPTEKMDVTFIASKVASNEDGASSNGSDDWYAMLNRYYNLAKNPKYKVESGYESKTRGDNDIQSLKIGYSINDKLKFTSISSRKFTGWNGRADYDYHKEDYVSAYQDSMYWRVSQEFRLDWKSDRLKYLIGFYGDKNENDYYDEWNQYFPGMGALSIPREFEGTGTSYSLFGQLEYLCTNSIAAILGLRYEKQFMDFDAAQNEKEGRDWDEVSPKVALKYAFNSNVTGYVSATKGYRSGGFNNLKKSEDKDYLCFDPEKLWSYEAGFKAAILKNRLMVSAGVYYMDIEDMQVEEALYETQGGYQSYTTNAAEATAKGGELEVVFHAMKNFTINAGLGISDVTFDEFEDQSGDYSGNDNPFAPNYTFNLGFQYRDEKGLFLKADLIGCDDIFLDRSNKGKRDEYRLVNVKAGWEFESFDIYVYGDNLFDKDYTTYNYAGMLDIYSDPREIGIQAVYRF